MIRVNEDSGAGTFTDKRTTQNGSKSGLDGTTPPDRGHAEPHVKPPATATPSPAPGLLEAPTGGGVRVEVADANKSPEKALSPTAPTTAAQDGNRKYENPNSAAAKKRESEGEGGESSKRGGGVGIPRKRGTGARGVVAVEEAGRSDKREDGAGNEAGTGAPPEKMPRFSARVSDHARRLGGVVLCFPCFAGI